MFDVTRSLRSLRSVEILSGARSARTQRSSADFVALRPSPGAPPQTPAGGSAPRPPFARSSQAHVLSQGLA
jgi:hypothetical protein